MLNVPPLAAQVTSPDVSLVLKLQQKLKEVESDRDRLERRLERLEQGTPDSENKQAHDQIRVRCTHDRGEMYSIFNMRCMLNIK